MDLEKVLALLRGELENLDAAIVSLERLQQRQGRRGRPPAWLADLKKPPRRGRPPKKTGRTSDHNEGE